MIIMTFSLDVLQRPNMVLVCIVLNYIQQFRVKEFDAQDPSRAYFDINCIRLGGRGGNCCFWKDPVEAPQKLIFLVGPPTHYRPMINLGPFQLLQFQTRQELLIVFLLHYLSCENQVLNFVVLFAFDDLINTCPDTIFSFYI